MREMPFKSATQTSHFMYLHYLVQTKQTGWPICTNTSIELLNLVRTRLSTGICININFVISVTNDSQLLTKPVWVPDSMSKECMVCSVKFTAFIRKHHCRRCGRVVCTTCSPHRMAPNPHAKTSQYLSLDTKKMERVCKDCFKDMSSMNSRLGGYNDIVVPFFLYCASFFLKVPQVQQPPTAAVAAQVVSNVLQSASTFAKNEGHDSSTDTDDSDDSENEKVQLITVYARVLLHSHGECMQEIGET